MLHVVPILCLIAFVWMLEVRLKNDLHQIELEVSELKRRLDKEILKKKNVIV